MAVLYSVASSVFLRKHPSCPDLCNVIAVIVLQCGRNPNCTSFSHRIVDSVKMSLLLKPHRLPWLKAIGLEIGAIDDLGWEVMVIGRRNIDQLDVAGIALSPIGSQYTLAWLQR
ncbi:hypothetical protein Y032_0112g313 [Ancylostoma ceylanicum]|uniref:Uncharacterized protein n=1 Tax=Ancylostoma ceylanicum TaxID=53326 RepID=A0A016TE32_9BILA|nr:hypothetical protein Y032_0112g313 [Ancylostoma ceylanicum]